ncbi:siderophore-interacting protein [Winogradskya humida]|uniref:Siderophore-interacting protein n=2 Tax=Winogradskya humida TaxID=113566 RepID=A0ABQ4A470_9ACTN|nr:siderophore-interacting protein [Actinoplanes humidus]
MLALTVIAREEISPHFMRVTLGGDDVRHLEQQGFDQWGRLFFAGPGQDEVALPASERWMIQNALQPARRRPRVRSYTIRRFRPEISAFDIEVAVHQEAATADRPAAPGTAWALSAKPGDRVAFLDEGCGYVPQPDAEWQLLAGDESALPAIVAILERSTAALPADVYLEIPSDSDIRDDITAPQGSRIQWLPRNDPGLAPGSLALQAVTGTPLRSGPFYAWTAGESSLATSIRRHLVGAHGVPRSHVAFRGYWRQGRASLG